MIIHRSGGSPKTSGAGVFSVGQRFWKKLRRTGPQVYLASREDIFHVQRLLSRLPVMQDSTYLGIIGGLGTLNFIAALEPIRIILVDAHKDQVEYAQAFLDLIRMSASREEFVERFFSRKYVSDEAAFLGQPGDRALFDKTLRNMRHPEVFQKYFSPIRDAPSGPDGLHIRGNGLCRRLKLTGPPRGTPSGENFLYFGAGWLRDEASYARLRSVLGRAELVFVHSSIADVEVDLSGKCLYFHGSNVLDSSPRPYRRFLSRVHRSLSNLDRDAVFIHFSTYHAVNITRFKKFSLLAGDVHRDCALKVAAWTRGKDVLELVPGDFGFGRELEAGSLEVKKVETFHPAQIRRRYDVAVSHILFGSRFRRLGRRRFEKLLDELLNLAEELVVVEHNSESLDFRGGRRLSLEDIARILGKYDGAEMQVEFSKGERDSKRNIIIGLRI